MKHFPCPDSSSTPTPLLSQSIFQQKKNRCSSTQLSQPSGIRVREQKQALWLSPQHTLHFSTMSLRLTITNLLLRSPFSSFNLENQTVEFTVQFSLECSTSLCWHQITFMLRTFHYLLLPSNNFYVDLKDFDSLLYILLKFSRNKLY